MKNQVFTYNGKNITFQLGNGDVMVNATQMAKPFGKVPWKWLELPSAKNFISALSENRSLADSQLIKSVKGGNNPELRGNWFHEDLALEFARWLNPAFAIWCNDRIKELLKYGATAINPDKLLENPDVLINALVQLKEERAEKARLACQNNLQQTALKEAAPKVNYYNEVLQSESTYTTNQIAKEMGMSAISLNKSLAAEKIQYKQSGTWLLYCKHQGQGYTKTKTHSFAGTDGKIRTSMTTVWTEKGRVFIHSLIEDSDK